MPPSRWTRTLGAFAATLIVAAVLVTGGGPAGAGAGHRVLVFGRFSSFVDSPTIRQSLASQLESLGHEVSVAVDLPTDLSGFDAVWHVGFAPLGTDQQDRLATYVRSGGGLHLSGESNCCEQDGDWIQAVVDAVVASGSVTVGGQGSVPGPHAFEPDAAGRVTTAPNALAAWAAQGAGAIAGVASPNVLARGAGGVAAGAVWDRPHVAGGQGRLTVLMDLRWLHPNEDPDLAVIENLEAFLGGSNSPPVVDAGGDVSGVEGGDLAVAGSAADPDGDALTLQWSATPGSGADAGAACTFDDPGAAATTVRCTDDGSYELVLTASDGVNPPVSATAALVVANAAPAVTVASPEDGTAVRAGTSVTLLATVVDPGSADELSCTVDWGDGTVVDVTPSGGVCDTAHTYTSAGLRQVVVAAADDDGGEAAEAIGLAVYDPGAGSVTGGGTTAAGPFNLSVRYRNGEETPAGAFRYSLGRGGPVLAATSFHWLVVPPDGSGAVVAGTGAVDGEDGYRFRLVVSPGHGRDAATLELHLWPPDGAPTAQSEPGPASVRSGAVRIHR